MQFLFLAFLFILGACLGSFLCCQARRLHAAPKKLGNRSVCLACQHKLKWYDNLPLVSWPLLRGRCRYCHAKIGAVEICAELASALVFLGLGACFVFGPLAPTFSGVPAQGSTLIPWLTFLTTLVFATLLLFLAIYDALYAQLPTLLLTFSIICAILILILKYWSFFSRATPSLFFSNLLTSGAPNILLFLAPLGSAAILGGTYLLLYLVSHGRWVGDGDWLLGIALGLALSSPWLALITLFLANALATLLLAPSIMKRQATRTHKHPRGDLSTSKTTTSKTAAKKAPHSPLDRQIPLGPFLVAAYFLVVVSADFIASFSPNML